MTKRYRIGGGYLCIQPSDNLVEKLEMFVNDLETQAWDDRQPLRFYLHLHLNGEEEITPYIVSLLVQLLNQPLPQAQHDNMDFESKRKWDLVALTECRMVQHDVTRAHLDDESYCAIDDRHLLASTLARRTTALGLTECPEILNDMFHVPHFEVTTFASMQAGLSASECAGVGHLVQRNIQLRTLIIESTYLEDPHVLIEALSNSIHLQTLRLNHKSLGRTAQQQEWSTAMVEEGPNVLVVPVLENIHRHLQELKIHGCKLEDWHLIAIAQMLPTSQLQVLDVSSNNIQIQGILELARQLPNIKCLKCLHLDGNPWQSIPEEREKGFAALLEGMVGNYSITTLFPVREGLLKYYLDMNHAGRHIMMASDPRVTLWPLILARAGKLYWPAYCSIPIDREYETTIRTRCANAVYFFLRNCHPSIL